MIATIIFYVSFALIAAMLLNKRLEISNRKHYAFSRLAAGSDQAFHRLNESIHRAISYFNKHAFIAFLQWTAAHVLTWLRNLYIKLFHLAHRHPHSKKVIDMVRGKGEIHTRGGASFFLKKISEGSADSTAAFS